MPSLLVRRSVMLDSLHGMVHSLPDADELAGYVRAVAECGDRSAFGELFRHFAPRVAGFLMRAGLNADEAEDLAQETMATVWRKAALFDPDRAGVATWIFTIARNRRIDRARRSIRAAGATELLIHEEEDDAPSVEDLALTSERESRVRAALAHLSSEQEAVLRLSFFAEKPHGEIARELGIPLGTVKSRVRLAMNRIRALLEDAR